MNLDFLNPNVNQPVLVDPYQKLQEIITGINSQPLPGAKPMGTLEHILTAIAQASAVAASNDPGTVLSGQLKAKADERNAATQAIQNRQNLVNQATLQAGFQQAEGMAREQSEVRKEGRLFKQEVAKEQRGINLFKQQKQTEADIQLASNKSLLEQAEAFEATHEEARNRRKLNAAIIDLLPAKYQGAARWEAEAKTLVPNADPGMLRRIAEKEAGIVQESLTESEKILKLAVTRAQFDEAKKQRDLSEAKVKADIKESGQRGQAALIGANAAMLSAKNQTYNNTMQNWATKQKLDVMETQFYKTPTGEIVSLDEVNKLPVNGGKYTSIALPPAENIAEQQRRILQINTAVGQTKQQTDIINKKLEQGDQLANQIKEDLKTKTPEQVKQQILNSNLPQSEKDRAMEILGIKPTASSTFTKESITEGTPFMETRMGRGISAIGERFDKAGTVGYLRTRLQAAQESMKRAKTPEQKNTVQEIINDIQSRLNYALTQF